MPNNVQTSDTGDTKSVSSQKAIELKVEGHDKILKYLLIGIVASIILIVIDLYQDRSTTNRLLDFSTSYSKKEIELYNNVMGLENDLVLFKQCLELGGWRKCFN